MRKAIIAIVVVALLGAGSVAFATRSSGSREQAHVCQLAKDTVRAASPNPSETTFSTCGGDGMAVMRTTEDTYDVIGIASIADLNGETDSYLFMVSAWRTADGWETQLNYFKSNQP